MLKGCSSKFTKEVAGVFQGCFKDVSRKTKGCFEGVLRVSQGYFMDIQGGVSRKFQEF